MTPPASAPHRNAYRGTPNRAWLHLRLEAPDGTTWEGDLLVESGSPFAVIVSTALLAHLKRIDELPVTTNFGLMIGGWVRVAMPELGIDQLVLGYGSDAVVASAQTSSPDFDGLIGLPFLRLLEYGDDKAEFRVRAAAPSLP